MPHRRRDSLPSPGVRHEGGRLGGRMTEIRLALAGDTMLGRGVADRLATCSPDSLFAPELIQIAAEVDLFVLNLECCISDKGEPWQ